MTPTETLTKAIEKAIENGWTNYKTKVTKVTVNKYRHEDDFNGELRNIVYAIHFEDGAGLTAKTNVLELIYNHDFAKAIWNTPVFTNGTELHFVTRDGRSEWQYHLQNMVISEDPIKYLAQHMEDK